MKGFSLWLAGLVWGACSAYAQELHMPRNIKQAFSKGTRAADGRPGRHYWQNRARYDIAIELRPPGRTIEGREHITYFNESPDTLRELPVKLILNVHRPGAARDSDADPAYFSRGIEIDSLAINGVGRPWKEAGAYHTIQDIELSEPLSPGDSLTLFFQWHYEIALRSDREGMIDSTTFFLAYFYPKIAVYDDYTGWDRLEFFDLQEFYSDFNDYTLKVTVPAGYLVWATGVLQNPTAVLGPVYAERLEAAGRSDTVIHIVTAADLAAGQVTAQQRTNTWIWQAAGIPDVAVAVSDHFVWDAASVLADSAGQRRVYVQAAYNDTAAAYRQAVTFGRHAVSWLSDEWPGIPFPYPSMTVFQGYAAMEYPMMANVMVTPALTITRSLMDHEIAHTYFPFYMGVHETRYPFMDEGWAVFFELLMGRSYKPAQEADDLFKGWWVSSWSGNTAAEADLPLITPANMLRNPAYWINAYIKSSVSLLALKDLLGDDLFKKCLQEFIRRWQGKHPVPWDFFNTFSNVAGRNINWFWSNWFYSSCYIDLAIEQVARTPKGFDITVGNTGGLFVPVDLLVHFSDNSTVTIHRTPAVWSAGQQQVVVAVTGKKKIRSVELQPGVFLDADESNNKWAAAL
ncbi:M1 family metallopeptidase [Chitinophaga japonensis]|nr:M1 family metallopeptidase [Chitinophaga japonensis]